MKIRVLVFLLLCSSIMMAQTSAQGEAFFNKKEYQKALNVYEHMLKRYPRSHLYNYRYARCCYELKNYDKAIKYFGKAGDKYPLKYLYLGEMYFSKYQFDDALTAYRDYLQSLDESDSIRPQIEEKIRKSQIGSNLIKRVQDIALIDSEVVNKNDFLRFYNFSKDLGTLTQKRIKLSNHQTCDKIVYTTQRGDRKCFSDSVNGNMNIFSSYKLLDSWTKPTSISDMINTPGNENYPFLLLDGVTLYYASNGANSIGGYDIFMTRYSAATKDYLMPENVGFPFNSTANDYMMVIDEQRHVGWFASDRNQPPGKVMIYEFVPNEPKIYFHSDNQDSLRDVAILKIARKAKFAEKSHVKMKKDESISADSDMMIVINDSTVYRHSDQFQSTTALNKYKEWLKLRGEIGKLRSQLEQLRQEYSEEQNSKQRKKLSKSIPVLEQKLINLEKQAKDTLLKASNEEIRFLKNN